MSSLRHSLEVCQGSEDGVDVGEVGDVVAEVGHRRLVDRRKPDRLHPEVRGQVLEPALNA